MTWFTKLLPRRQMPPGLRLALHKTKDLSIKTVPLPERLRFPLWLSKHINLQPCVRPGDKVLKNQVIARSVSPYPHTLYASTSGTIKAIKEFAVINHSHDKLPCIELIADGLDQARPTTPLDWAQLGLLGLGGGGFPSYAKWCSNQTEQPRLLINAVECEPYISCDAALLQTAGVKVMAAIVWLLDFLKLSRADIVFAAHNQSLRKLCQSYCTDPRLRWHEVPDHYPQGSEQQLVRLLTGQEIPQGKKASHLGILSHNVGTVYALALGLRDQQPLISRIVTFTGSACSHPCNLDIRLGTPLSHCLAHLPEPIQHDVILSQGGTMMLTPIEDRDVPIVAETNCIMIRKPVPQRRSLPCIRCGACSAVCPIGLLPHQLHHFGQPQPDPDKLSHYHLNACIECGCCDAVCPSQIPLVQQFRASKATLRSQEQEAKLASAAKKRYELRSERLIQRQLEARQKNNSIRPGAGKEARKQAILAAVARQAAKKRQQQEPTD